jgi:subtilase family serine protease
MSKVMLPQFSLLEKQFTRRIALLALGLLALPAAQVRAENDVPGVVQFASDHGLAQASQQATITVHLKLRDQAGFDKAVEELYRAGSPTYHQWLTPEKVASYGASASDIETVKKELESHGLAILETDAGNSTVRARGSIAQLQSAFQTQIHEFERGGKLFRSNVTSAKLTGSAGELVKAVSGLSSLPIKSHAAFPIDPKTGKARSLIAVKAGTNPVLSDYFTNVGFAGAATIQLTTQDNPPLPAATYFGNVYAPAPNVQVGWTPKQLQTYYGLETAYAAGYQGEGQTIVLVDGPSYGTQVASDFANFSKWTGLPKPTSSNFKVIYPDGKPNALELEYITDWTEEADLDVQWAHAIAPKANIVLLITPTQDWSELEYAIQYAVKNKLGNIISNSYGYPEFLWGKATAQGFEQVLQSAAAQGYTVNFSSGDYGDEGTGVPNGGGAEYPSTSAWATAVGGTSIGILNANGSTSEVGWGNNVTYLSYGWTYPEQPYNGGFVYGSGGGESGFFGKPSWQSSLPGKGRQAPDIAALADPETGGVFVYYGGLGVIGGTSLASPIFSGILSLASEKAGGAPLGQVARLFPTLPSSAIKDIVPVSSPQNVTGIYVTSAGTEYYSASALVAPLSNTTKFYSALWDDSGDHEGYYLALTFGTDTSLTVTKGWDNVTGWGVPSGYTFIKDLASAVTPTTK